MKHRYFIYNHGGIREIFKTNQDGSKEMRLYDNGLFSHKMGKWIKTVDGNNLVLLTPKFPLSYKELTKEEAFLEMI